MISGQELDVDDAALVQLVGCDSVIRFILCDHTFPSVPSSNVYMLATSGRLLFRRSEEHTSELQSLMRISYAVFCLKKKKIITVNMNHIQQHYSLVTHLINSYV